MANSPEWSGQEDQALSSRKVLDKIVPEYSPTARSLRLSGIVKVEALVARNGVVKVVEVKGGHPVLIRSVMDAVQKWKWEPGSHETRESIEIRFNPK